MLHKCGHTILFACSMGLLSYCKKQKCIKLQDIYSEIQIGSFAQHCLRTTWTFDPFSTLHVAKVHNKEKLLDQNNILT